MIRRILPARVAAVLLLLVAPAAAQPLFAPGDPLLRHDLTLLADAGPLGLPLTSWPLATADVAAAVAGVDADALGPAERNAYDRLRAALQAASGKPGPEFRFELAAAANPRFVRTFEDTVRDEASARAELAWSQRRFFLRLSAAAIQDPDDGERFRPDGSLLGAQLGNWLLSAGWQDRWWGPGHGGSLVLSNNARPLPALAVQRVESRPFESRWLSWIGPWTASAFMGQLDDERVVDDALLFGMRVAFRPHPSVEFGLSRTAQWCGDGRPCDASTFGKLLLGRDNRGVNVGAADEPGNQLGGFDLRWQLPRLPAAVYAQWIGEDSRRGGPEIGSWLRLAGLEAGRTQGGAAQRIYVEVAETSCRDGGLGFSERVADCAYEHPVYGRGYRYRDRAIGRGMDGDGLSFSIGASLVQSAGHAWFLTARAMEINRVGRASARHTLSATAQDRFDLQLSHRRELAGGVLHAGVGYRYLDDVVRGERNDATGFVRWSSR